MIALAMSHLIAQTPPPSVVLNSFLEHIAFRVESDQPIAMFSTFQVAFVPSGAQPKLLLKEGGNLLTELVLRGSPVVAGAYTVYGSKEQGGISLGKGDGVRSVEMYYGDKLAGKLEFTMTRQGNGDPLDPKATWKVVGPWKDYAYFKHKPDDGNRQDIGLVYWVALNELPPGVKNCMAIVKKGNTVVASTRENYPKGVMYSRFDTPLMKPDKNPWSVKELSSMAGSYTLEIVSGGKVLRSWPVKIAGGDIVAHPRSDFNKYTGADWLSPRMVLNQEVIPHTLYWVGPNKE